MLDIHETAYAELATLLHEAMCTIRKSAHFVVCTNQASLEDHCTCNLTPTIIVCDESSKADELVGVGALVCFPHTKKYLFTLDSLQLGPVHKSTVNDNVFAPQNRVAFPLRLICGGFPAFVIAETVRFGPAISSAISSVFWKGYLHTAASYKEPHQALIVAIKQRLRVASICFAVNVTTGRELIIQPFSSRINVDTANAALCLAALVVRLSGGAITFADVQIITGYVAQKTVLEQGRDLLARQPELLHAGGAREWKALSIATTDSV